MAQQPNRLLRAGVPLGLVVIAIGVAAAVFVNSGRAANKKAQQPPKIAEPAADSVSAPTAEPEIADQAPQPETQSDTQADVAPTDVADAAPDQQADEAQPADAEPDETPEAPALAVAANSGLHVRPVEQSQPWAPLGGLDAAGSDRVKIEFSPVGAGIASLRLAGEFVDIQTLTAYKAGDPVSEDQHVQIQSEQHVGPSTLTPFAALWVEINGEPVPLVGQNVWRELGPGSFEAIIEDEGGQPVARVTRRYELTDGSNDLSIEQHITNLTSAPLRASFVQFGPIDLPKDEVTYGGDKRRVRFGYLLRPALDINREFVQARKFLTPRTSVLSPRDKTQLWTDPKTGKTFNPYVVDHRIWPNEKSEGAGLELVWAAMASRYYGVAVHGVHKDSTTGLAFDLIDHIDRVVLQQPDQPRGGTLILRLVSKERTVAPGESFDASVALYAGPTNRTEIALSPAAEAAGIDKMVVYNFGGPCAMCTFSWLSDPILGLLRFLHSVVHDWAISIIILVFCVRGLLHPINRFSQIRMQRFAKQMQDLGPKQKKIQEKYGDDKQRAQQEMAKLWREEGVNPAGMLGCLPMVLQSPVWIALYATLYFLYDLRQEPAFFGIFQNLSGGAWPFMADLSAPDHFIPLPDSWHFTLPLMGVIKSINVLPVILAFVFYAHQKFLTPPTANTMTEQQQQQQKMIKLMTVFMFPVIMYNAPCGLALYFIANSTTAIIENTWIRAHIKKHNLLDVKREPKKPRGGLMARLRDISEKQQTLRDMQKNMRESAGGPGGKGDGKESAAQRAMRKGRK